MSSQPSTATYLRSLLRIADAKYAVLGELLFVLLPLEVLLIVSCVHGNVRSFLSSPEWSFAAAILFGLAIYRFTTGLSHATPGSWELPSLIVATVIVFGLVPSLTVLALILAQEPPRLFLAALQLLLFASAMGTFIVLATMGHFALFHPYANVPPSHPQSQLPSAPPAQASAQGSSPTSSTSATT
jgi:hypothetical protein